jgi:hypothetical protein
VLTLQIDDAAPDLSSHHASLSDGGSNSGQAVGSCQETNRPSDGRSSVPSRARLPTPQLRRMRDALRRVDADAAIREHEEIQKACLENRDRLRALRLERDKLECEAGSKSFGGIRPVRQAN